MIEVELWILPLGTLVIIAKKNLDKKRRQLVVVPVCDVDHRSSKLFWFQSFLQFHQLALEKGSHSKGIQFNRSFTDIIRSKIKAHLLLLEGGVQPSLHIHPIMSVRGETVECWKSEIGKPVVLVLLGVPERGVMQSHNLVHTPCLSKQCQLRHQGDSQNDFVSCLRRILMMVGL